MTAAKHANEQVVANETNEGFHELRVARIIDETSDARSYVLEIPTALADAFRYRAGQFVTVGIPYEGRELRRCYSLASAPGIDAEHKITVKRVAEGRVSNWINDNLCAGDPIKVAPPGGFFTLNDNDDDLVMFAGGSGITPVISLVKFALANTKRMVKLVYANRDRASVIFAAELEWLGRRHGTRLEMIHHLDDAFGLLDLAGARSHVVGRTDAEFYICGPDGLMAVVEGALRASGVDEGRIHVERFVSPPDEAEGEALAYPTAARDAEVVELDVHLDGRIHEVRCEPGQTILAAVQAAGLQPPFSCTDGFCGCCMAKLRDGEVRMRKNDFLSDAELAQGWVLTCQSLPTTPRCTVEYPD